jgi:CRP-like cAMP-binding protein
MDLGKFKAVRQSSVFRKLDISAMDAVFRSACERKVRQGEFFFLQGDASGSFYVLDEGRVRLTRLTAEGHQVILRFIGPGQPFGAVSAFNESQYPTSAEAVIDSTAVYWEGEAMNALMERFPRITLNFLSMLTEQVRELQDRYVELSTERVERRVARTLIRLTRSAGRKVSEGVLIDISLSRQDLAEMTGTTLYTVSRILSRWEDRGIVRSERERIIITYPHGLVIIAEDLPDLGAGDETHGGT